MKRRDFLAASALGTVAVGTGALPIGAAAAAPSGVPASRRGKVQNPNRKILIAGGGFGTTFIKYMAELTGKQRPKLCYLRTASADGPGGSLRFFQNCATLEV